ncbi:hypothetical protein BDR26DRAFT_860088, partial [Obelidium mucronatum]
MYLPECVISFSGAPNWATILIAAVLILLGLYVGVYGGSGSYLALYANGFLSVSTICTIITWNAEPFEGYSQRAALYLSVWTMTGFSGGLIFGFTPYYGHIIANSLYGLFFGFEFLALASGGLFNTVASRTLFLIPFITIPLALSYFHPKYVLSVMSGLAGAFILLLGLDLFLQQGLLIGIAAFATLSEVGADAASNYIFDFPKQIMISSSLLLGLVAAVFQYRYALQIFGKTKGASSACI